MPERRVAGFEVSDGTNALANILGYEIASEISEEEVAGLGDTVGDPPIISEKYLAQSVGKTANINGIVFSGGGVTGDGPTDAALSSYITNAETGAAMTLEYRYNDGSGYDLNGFFTNFTLTGDKGEATEKYSGSFRVNSKTAVQVPV